MRATEELLREHRAVEEALDALERALDGTRGIPTAFLRRLVAFCQAAVDRCHHGKEEGCFFPCLERRGIARDGGPIGVMLEEHEILRGIVSRIAARVGPVRAARIADPEVLDLCRQYSDLLRLHMAKENEVLFPMAAAVMEGDDDRDTGECYEAVEAEAGGSELRRPRALAEDAGAASDPGPRSCPCAAQSPGITGDDAAGRA